jgi:hypothetical protein
MVLRAVLTFRLDTGNKHWGYLEYEEFSSTCLCPSRPLSRRGIHPANSGMNTSKGAGKFYRPEFFQG